MKKQSGFTLIELLLVLAIIGIISAIAIPALLGQRERAKAKAVGSMVANITGECARVNDALRESTGATPTASVVVSAVLKMPNYQYPAAKNPYGGTTTPYTATATTAFGSVYLSANSAYVDPANTASKYPAVIIASTYKDGTSTKTVTKVVALD
jgi:prepilin-type N-terminal cleavage/methylation domain-containing protein